MSTSELQVQICRHWACEKPHRRQQIYKKIKHLIRTCVCTEPKKIEYSETTDIYDFSENCAQVLVHGFYNSYYAQARDYVFVHMQNCFYTAFARSEFLQKRVDILRELADSALVDLQPEIKKIQHELKQIHAQTRIILAA